MMPTPKITTIWGVRHGQTLSNATRRVQGHLDTDLDDTGRAQAKALGPLLQTLPWELAISSDLTRAAHTARLALGDRADALTLNPHLRERNLGILEGLTHDDAQRQHPQAWAVFRRQADLDTPLTGGESLAEFHRRCIDALDNLVNTHPGRNIVLFTHGGVLRQWFRHVVGLPPDAPRHFSSVNASLCELQHRGPEKGWRLQTWGRVDHLAGFLQH